jgi:hypothetical protein
MIAVEQGDVLEWAAAYDGPPFHALLCDPPYELGFMSKSWDATGITYQPDTWAALAAHLYPGGFLMAFGGSRTWHRLACAIEDAGLVIHPSIFVYCYGSGFPKATRIERNGNGHSEWAGHRYGLQALKPAAEPIIVAQKPYAGKPIECITATGAGALWVDGGRIGTEAVVSLKGLGNNRNLNDDNWKGIGKKPKPTVSCGRWPANFALVHSFLPVMRLRDTIPPQTETEIRGYYNGYTAVSLLRQGRRTTTIKAERGAEVLQSRMRQQRQEGETAPTTERAGDANLPTMRQGVSVLSSVGQEGQAEVLQLGLQDRVPEDIDGREKRQVRGSTYRSNQGEDESAAPVNSGREQPALDRRQVSGAPWIQVCPSDEPEASDAESSQDDGYQERLHTGTPSGNGNQDRSTAGAGGEGASHRRGQGQQRYSEPDDRGQSRAFTQPQGDCAEDRGVGAGSGTLEVLAGDVPEQWLGYFQYAGENLGCRRIGTERVRQRSGSVSGNEPSHTGDENASCYSEYERVPFRRYADADGLETVDAWDCVEGCPVRALALQNGGRSVTGVRSQRSREAVVAGTTFGVDNHCSTEYPNDKGGTAARFFFQASWAAEVAERIAAADPVRYNAKAARSERDAGLEGMALKDSMKWAGGSEKMAGVAGKYPDGSPRPPQYARNPHPTVKPIALCRWLATLLLPPAEYAPRRICIPFAGSGSEMIAAALAGWEEVVGIEKEAEYVEIAEARLAHWTAQSQLALPLAAYANTPGAP